MIKKEKFWNPKVSSCSHCPEFKPIITDKQTKTVDPHKKLCQKFSWEIESSEDPKKPALAEKQAICKITREKRRRPRKR